MYMPVKEIHKLFILHIIYVYILYEQLLSVFSLCCGLIHREKDFWTCSSGTAAVLSSISYGHGLMKG